MFAELTDQDVIDAVNTKNKSGIFNIEKDFLSKLGDISYNSSGHIVSAGVATIGWVAKVKKDYEFTTFSKWPVNGLQLKMQAFDLCSWIV